MISGLKEAPQWDALDRGRDNEVFLVEAKVNIEEIISPKTKATGKALELIKKSLDASKKIPQSVQVRTNYQNT